MGGEFCALQNLSAQNKPIPLNTSEIGTVACNSSRFASHNSIDQSAESCDHTDLSDFSRLSLGTWKKHSVAKSAQPLLIHVSPPSTVYKIIVMWYIGTGCSLMDFYHYLLCWVQVPINGTVLSGVIGEGAPPTHSLRSKLNIVVAYDMTSAFTINIILT